LFQNTHSACRERQPRVPEYKEQHSLSWGTTKADDGDSEMSEIMTMGFDHAKNQ